jgi:hypothetical protein
MNLAIHIRYIHQMVLHEIRWITLFIIIIFLTNQNGIYINSKEVIHLAQGVQRRTTHQNTQLRVCFQKHNNNGRANRKKMLHKNTHANQRMPPPVIITESESSHFGL